MGHPGQYMVSDQAEVSPDSKPSKGKFGDMGTVHAKRCQSRSPSRTWKSRGFMSR